MAAVWKKIVKTLGYCVAVVIIFAALLVSTSRLLTPYLNQHRADFERWASQLLKRPIVIQELHVTWHRYEPELELNGVNVLNVQTQKPALTIPTLTINFSLWSSLFHWQMMLDSIRIKGVHLTLRQQPSGLVNVEGFKDIAITDNFTGQSLNSDVIFAWIFSQSALVLRDIDIHFFDKNKQEKSITLDQLALQNNGNTHVLTGRAILNQSAPLSVTTRLKWQGDITDISHIKARLYLYVEGIYLPQWLEKKSWQNLQMRQGVGSAKIWASWNNNTWQKIQSQFQFYNLQAVSLITKKLLVIDRMSGNVGWKRDGENEILAGEDVFIDLPSHLWPVTNFTVKFSRTAEGMPNIKTISLGYLDVADSSALLQETGLLSKEYSDLLTVLDPHAELRFFQGNFQEPLTDPANISLSGTFNGLTLNAWKNFPAVTNLRGELAWTGKQGGLKLDSQNSTVELNQVFEDPLQFDQLSGVVHWQKDANGNWSFVAKKLSVVNQDAAASVDMTFLMPPNDSPTIHLTGDFNVKNVVNITSYLPLKIYDPALIKWLNAAFVSGHAQNGKVNLQGRLSDFPFDNGTGTFMIGSDVDDVQLHYAPNWPDLRHLKGKLIFAGRSMAIDINSGQLLNIPLGAVHAEIPYFGDKQPQVVNVNTIVQADFLQGLNFIQRSPLRDTLGKDLAALQLKGPMQLKLALMIPLHAPENAKVIGDTVLSNTILNLPAWKLTLDHLNGALHFTEDSVVATNVQGQIFNQPVTLTLATEQSPGQPNRVTANLQGDVSVAALQSWLALPLDKTAQGATHYQADLRLAAHKTAQPTQVTVTSDLKGIAINLPGAYGKKAEDSTDFQLDIKASPDQPLQTKLHYGKLLSAALILEETVNGIHVASGNLRLGSGEPALPTQAGFIVTGEVDQLDWSIIQPYFSATSKKNPPAINPDLFRGADITVHTVNAFGLNLKQLRIQVQKSPSALQVRLNNADMSGQISLPVNMDRYLVQARFDRLFLSAQDSSNVQGTMNPRTVPAFSFIGNDVRYDGKPLGQVTLNTVRSSNGLAIRQLKFESKLFKLNATGAWQSTGNHSSSTHLRGSVSSPSVSDMLTAWGFSSKNLVGSSGDVQFDLAWPGAPFSPSLKNMSGNMSLKLTEGRIINLSNDTDAKMGLGRLLNVFSLQTIPRRLSLDFSDVFEKGYSFDSMQGSFTFRNGDAVTRDTRFDGPIARVDIAGRIGLVAKNFDMKMSVTPYVTSSLPVVAAIAGGPIVGAATWVVNAVVSHAVSKVTTYDYSVTGPWDNPVWTQVSARQASH